MPKGNAGGISSTVRFAFGRCGVAVGGYGAMGIQSRGGGVLCKSLLVAMAKEFERRALQALLPHNVHGNRPAQGGVRI